MYDQLPRMSQKKAASRLNIPQTLLWTLLRNRSLVMSGDQNVRCGKVPSLEAALWRWIDVSKRQGVPVSDLMIHRKAMDLAARMGVSHFRASPTWYSGFKRRESAVREKYHIHQDDADRAEEPKPNKEDRPAAASLSHQQTAEWEREIKPERHEVRLDQNEPPRVKREPTEPTVVMAEINGDLQTITVPSLFQMKEAMKTLATGLLYRGFCDFKLLHQFEKEVANVVKRSMAQGSQDTGSLEGQMSATFIQGRLAGTRTEHGGHAAPFTFTDDLRVRGSCAAGMLGVLRRLATVSSSNEEAVTVKGRQTLDVQRKREKMAQSWNPHYLAVDGDKADASLKSVYFSLMHRYTEEARKERNSDMVVREMEFLGLELCSPVLL
ncbi:hypothetical protein NFI96_002226 [Prochilodus magdalenae]|nr:hypothetical protein NFI96_002226 [Prochilodus magdalenae]